MTRLTALLSKPCSEMASSNKNDFAFMGMVMPRSFSVVRMNCFFVRRTGSLPPAMSVSNILSL